MCLNTLTSLRAVSSQAQEEPCQGYRPQPLSRPTISAPPHSSTTIGIDIDERCSEPGADGTRIGPADLRSGRAGAVPAAQLYSPARACPARRRGHSAGRLLRAGGSESPADADRARHRLAVSRGAESHHRPLPEEEAG